MITNVAAGFPGTHGYALLATNWFPNSPWSFRYSSSNRPIEEIFGGKVVLNVLAHGTNWTVEFEMPDWPPHLGMSNLTALQSVDVSNDFAFEFEAGGDPGHSVFIGIHDINGGVRDMPHPLNGSSNHLRIAAGTLPGGTRFGLSWETRARIHVQTNGLEVRSEAVSRTRSQLVTVGGDPIRLSRPSFSNGKFNVVATLNGGGQPYALQRSFDATNWTYVANAWVETSAYTDLVEQPFEDNRATNAVVLYRVVKEDLGLDDDGLGWD